MNHRPIKMDDLGLLGPLYTFHDIARRKFLPHYTPKFYDTFDELFEGIAKNEVKRALIAISNSSNGLVEDNEQRIQALSLKVIDTFQQPIKLHIGSKYPNTLESLKKIYSHPMAIKETQGFFKKYSHLTFIATNSTAGAIEEHLNQKEVHAAVIAGEAALDHYGLLNIAKDIADEPNNATTFCLVEK